MWSSSRTLFSNSRTSLAVKSWSPILVQPLNGKFCVLPLSIFFPSQWLALQVVYVETREGPAKKTAFRAGCTTYADLTLLICLPDAYCPRLYASASCTMARGQFNAAQARGPFVPSTNYTVTSAIAPCSLLLTLIGLPWMLHYHQEGGCQTGGQYRHAGVYAKTSCECVARP